MKRALLNLTLLAAATVAALGVAEVAVRLARPGLSIPPKYPDNPFWRHDPELGWLHRPGQEGSFSREEFSHPVAINSMGFRDIERDPDPPPPGSLRVAVLGDSFTWGHGVGDDEIFTRLLEERLGAAEVWNLGVSSFSTDQELLLYRKIAPVLKPDLVLLMVCRNDFAANTTHVSGRYSKPAFLPSGEGFTLTGVPVPEPGLLNRMTIALRKRSAFVNGLWFLAVDAGLAPRGPRGWDLQERTMHFLLDTLREDLSSQGARLAVVVVPSVAHVYYEEILGSEARGDRILQDWAERSGERLLDLTPGFRRAFRESGARYHHRRDKHWNAEGHRLAAELLSEMLAPPAGTPYSM